MTAGATPTDDVDLTLLMMRNVTADAKGRKKQCGIKGGRKLRGPVHHFSTGYPPGVVPSQEQCIADNRRLLAAIGCSDRYSLLVAHVDGGVFHTHSITARCHPETGRAAPMNLAGTRLQEEAERIERDSGRIDVPARNEGRKAREAVQAEVNEKMRNFVPSGRTQTERKRELGQERKRIRRESYARRPFPAAENTRHIRPGRPRRSEAHTAEWRELYKRHRLDGIDGTPQAREEEIALGRIQKLEELALRHAPVIPAPPAVAVQPALPPALEVLAVPSVAPAPAAVAMQATLAPALEVLAVPSVAPAPAAVAMQATLAPALEVLAVPSVAPAPAAVAAQPELAPDQPPIAIPSVAPAPAAVAVQPELAPDQPPIAVPVATPAPPIHELPEPPAPPHLVAPAAEEIEELLNDEAVDASPATAARIQQQFARARDRTDRLARAALTVATARGTDRPLESHAQQDARTAHRKAVSDYLNDRYGRRPGKEMLDLEAARRPVDPEHVEQARRSRLQQLVDYLTKEVRMICSGWLNRAPAPAPADAPAKRALTPPPNPVAAPPLATSNRQQPAPRRQTPGD